MKHSNCVVCGVRKDPFLSDCWSFFEQLKHLAWYRHLAFFIQTKIATNSQVKVNLESKKRFKFFYSLFKSESLQSPRLV